MPRETFKHDELTDEEVDLKIRTQMGPAGFRSVDMTKAAVIPRRVSGLHGFRTPEGFTESGWMDYYSDFDAALEEAGRGGLEDEHVYAMGDREATAQLFGHEFRHGAGLLSGDFDAEEKMNRVWDGFRADTLEKWESAVQMWMDQMGREEGRDANTYTFQEAEESLKKAIGENLERFATQESTSEMDYNTEVTGQHGLNEELEGYKKLAVERWEQRQELIDEDLQARKDKYNN